MIRFRLASIHTFQLFVSRHRQTASCPIREQQLEENDQLEPAVANALGIAVQIVGVQRLLHLS